MDAPRPRPAPGLRCRDHRRARAPPGGSEADGKACRLLLHTFPPSPPGGQPLGTCGRTASPAWSRPAAAATREGVPWGARTPGGRLQTTHGCGLLAAEDMERCGHRTAKQFTDGGDGHWRATAGTARPTAAYRPPRSGQFLTRRGGDAVAEAEAGSSARPVRPWAMFRVLPSLRVRVLESPLLVFLGPGGGEGRGPASRWPTACGCVWLEGSRPGLGWPSVSHRGWVPALRYL